MPPREPVTDAPGDAHRADPRNVAVLVTSSALTKIGDELANPKTVLAWLLPFVGAPSFLVGLLVPIRESGSLLPQPIIAGFIRRMARRKPAWLLGALVQCAAVVAIGLAATTLTGAAAGWTIIGGLVVFSLARGICSIASKDILGKTVPKTRRGRVTGLAASVAGLAATGAGLWLTGVGEIEPATYGWLVVAAGLTWLVAAGVFSLLDEARGETAEGGNALLDAWRRLGLLRTDRRFRRFVMTRALLVSTALAAPYYVLLAQEAGGARASQLGLFVVASSLARSLSSVIWGRLADVSSRNVLVAAATMASALGVATFIVDRAAPQLMAATWACPAAFFLLGVAHAGVRLGRKTYVVDMAAGNRRTDYVAVSNAVIGAVLLLTGSLGALSTFLAPSSILLVLAVLGLAGAVLGRTLPEVE
ncbi:MAG: MFS transporter [Planctomycetota bacterium]